jgi:hypothetical protein
MAGLRAPPASGNASGAPSPASDDPLPYRRKRRSFRTQAIRIFSPEGDPRDGLPDGLIRYQSTSITNDQRTQDDATENLACRPHCETDEARVRARDGYRAVKVEEGQVHRFLR